MIIFETERLIIRRIEMEDKKHFTELFIKPKILELIPQKALAKNLITSRFNKSINFELSDLTQKKCACGIYEKGNREMIGLALFLLNDDNGNELGYRFRTEYWGKGYGTETTKGMLEFYFNVLKTDIVTADVNIVNLASVKILQKFMLPVKEFFNKRDNCTDRRYELKKNNWLQQST